MRRERPALTFASGMALGSVLLAVLALLLLGATEFGPVHDATVGRVGWLALAGSFLTGTVAIAKGFVFPIRRLELRANALAAGDRVRLEPVSEDESMAPLREAFNSVARRLDLLTDIAELLASAADRESVLSGITSAMAHMPDSAGTAVLLLQDENTLELVAAEGSLRSRLGATFRLDMLPWVARALSVGAPVHAVQEHDAVLHGRESAELVSVLAAPLRVEDTPLGVAVVVRDEARAFSEPEFETLRSFAAQASVALRNSQLFDEERRSRREAEWLRAIAERAAVAGPPEETLDDIANMGAALLGLDDSLVLLLDGKQFGAEPTTAETLARGFRAAWEAEGEVAPSATAVCVEAANAPASVRQSFVSRDAVRAVVAPLYRGDVPEGYIVLFGTARGTEPSADLLRLAATVGRQASLVLENAFLYQQARGRADNLETIFRISHAVGSSLQSRVVLNRVLDVVQKILSADAVLLMRYDTQRRAITSPMARGAVSEQMLHAVFKPGEDVPGRIFETREPERYDRVSGTDTQLLNMVAGEGLESLLAVPLLARGRSIGVLVVMARAEAAFTNEDLDMLRTFGSQAALAIDNADLFSREHETVSVLQQSILPTRLPAIPGIEAASIYLPAGADSEIGGDYYDLFQTPDGGITIAIGDVCGKGVHAATKTSMIRHGLKGMVVAGVEPARVLAELNTMLLESEDRSNSIVTLWVGRIDPCTDTLTYANAGHPAGLLLQADRSIVRLETTGAILGAVSGAEWLQRDVAIDVGSLLLLYTDGVTEARRGTKFFGEGRVRRALRGGGSAEAVAHRLLAHVQNHAGGEIRDDVAILAARYGTATGASEGVTREPLGGKSVIGRSATWEASEE